jgi:hypothetical protein
MQEKEMKSKVHLRIFFFFDKVIREETYVHVECRREPPKLLQSKAQEIHKTIRNPTNNSTESYKERKKTALIATEDFQER